MSNLVFLKNYGDAVLLTVTDGFEFYSIKNLSNPFNCRSLIKNSESFNIEILKIDFKVNSIEVMCPILTN